MIIGTNFCHDIEKFIRYKYGFNDFANKILFYFRFLANKRHQFILRLIDRKIKSTSQFSIDLDYIGRYSINQISGVNRWNRRISERYEGRMDRAFALRVQDNLSDR